MNDCDEIQQADLSREWERHRRWIRTVIFARLNDVEAVEDVLQDVSLAVVKKIPEATSIRHVTAWLYKTALNQVNLYHRRHHREINRLQRIAANGWGPSEATRADPLDWLLNAERQQLVRRALEHLDDEDREILLLKYTESWSTKELAGHLGTTREAMDSRLHRARARLRCQLARLDITKADT